MAYGVRVRPEDVRRGIEMLENDGPATRRMQHYHIRRQGNGHVFRPGRRGIRTESKGNTKTLSARDRIPEDTDLGVSLLRRDQVEAARIGVSVHHCDQVTPTRNTFRPRRRIEDRLRKLTVRWAVRPDREIGGAVYSFQTWNGGRDIQRLGGSEWWHGTPGEGVRREQEEIRAIASAGWHGPRISARTADGPR